MKRLRIVSEKAIREFVDKHSEASADPVGARTAFDIAQNRYRLIAFISFRRQVLYVKAILTHEECDKGAWKK